MRASFSMAFRPQLSTASGCVTFRATMRSSTVSRALLSRWPSLHCVDEVAGFLHRDSRDLSGYEEVPLPTSKLVLYERSTP